MSTQLIRVLFYEKMRSPRPSEDPICLILGAGADISSGGMTFTELKKSCIEQFSKQSLPSFLSPEKTEAYFNDFFGKLVSEKDRAPVLDYLFHGMRSIKPSDGYKLLVLLAKAQVINAIVTTNFDANLEAAQEELGLDVFQIYAPGVASPYVIGRDLFLPPRPLYVKLHGDIRAKQITHLTSSEISSKGYDKNFSLLIQSIAQTHKLIFVGYSGNDEVFSSELKKIASKISDPIYWCNPSGLGNGNPLQSVFKKQKVVEVKATFDDLINDAGAYPLRNFTISVSEPHFLHPLLNDRISFANEQFIESCEYSDASTRLRVLQAREAKLDQISTFRFNSEKPLAVLTGFSGVGKTTLLCQLHDAESDTSPQKLLLLRARGLTTSDFAESLTLKLGLSATNPFSLLYELSIWLRNEGRQLLICIDGVNEFDWRSRSCLELFNEIVRVAHWTQPHNSLKFLVTIRPETWNEIYSNGAHEDLKRVLWSPSEFHDDLRALRLERFSEQELTSAYHSYSSFFGVTTPYRQLSESSKDQLADPYFLALAMKNGLNVDQGGTSYRLYDQVVKETLIRSFGSHKAESVDNSLLRLASIGLDKEEIEFSLETLESVGIGHEERRCLLEIPVLQKIDSENYFFAHDLIHEYFFSRSISELDRIQIRDQEELKKTVQIGNAHPKLTAALRKSIIYASPAKREHYLGLILGFLSGRSVTAELTSSEKQTVEFSRSVLVGLSRETPEILAELVGNLLDNKSLDTTKDPLLIRLLLRCLVYLPSEVALPLLCRIQSELPGDFSGEANVHFLDKLTNYLLSSGVIEDNSAFQSSFFNNRFPVTKGEAWNCLFRVFQLLTKLGPDNTHPLEWQRFSSQISDLLDQLSYVLIPSKAAESAIAELVVRNANVLLFNASPEIIEHFFMNPGRRELGAIVEDLEQSKLTLDHVLMCRRFITTLDQNVEFMIVNLLFVISMRKDPQDTLQLFSDYFATFDHGTPTEELDFFLSALSLSHLALGLECQEIVGYYTGRMIEELPQISSGYPAAVRGERRGFFIDPFEQQFEDGFNPLAFYFYNAPSRFRKSRFYLNYIADSTDETDQIPLYWRFLEKYEGSGNQLGIIRIIHVLGQMINIWPIEGLSAVEKLIGRTEPTIRRALIRVLNEANARFPNETSRMLSRVGAAFSEDERHEIYWSRDAHIGIRPMEQVEWARAMHFFDQRDKSGRTFIKAAKILTTSFSLPEALGRIVNELTNPTA